MRLKVKKNDNLVSIKREKKTEYNLMKLCE